MQHITRVRHWRSVHGRATTGRTTCCRDCIVKRAKKAVPDMFNTHRMAADIQVCLVWFVNGIAMLALEVWTGLLERLHKYLL